MRRELMSEVPKNLLYTKDHEWLRPEDDGSVTVGITDHAQKALGELVFVELPEKGDSFGAGDACAVVESVKAASDIYCPVAGQVTSVNQTLVDQPELVNQSAYSEGWVFSLVPDDVTELDAMMKAADYQQFIADLED
jgi:glycine cleavage system H protein